MNVETLTLDCFIDYDKYKRSLKLFEALRNQYPYESDEQIAQRRSTVQQMVADIMYEHNPDPQDYDYHTNGMKLQYRRKKPKLIFKHYDHVTIIHSTVPKQAIPARLSQHEKFIAELTRWARNRPEPTDEVLSIALLKYSELLITHPNKLNAYYMQAVKNNHIDEYRKRSAAKRGGGESLVPIQDQDKTHHDHYPIETEDWLNSLSDYQRQGLKQAIEFMQESDSKVPESIKRKIRNIKPPEVEVYRSTGRKLESNTESSNDKITEVETRQMTQYERLANVHRT